MPGFGSGHTVDGMTHEEARAVLGLTGGEDADQVKRAYLRLVKVHKPEKDPEAFKRIREAFELVRAFPLGVPAMGWAEAEAVAAPRPASSEPARAPEVIREPPKREPEPRYHDPWVLIRQPRQFVTALARSDDPLERSAAITALVELGVYHVAADALLDTMRADPKRDVVFFVLACRSIIGLLALGLDLEARTLHRALTRWAGSPVPESLLADADASFWWSYVVEAGRGAKVSKSLCRYAACHVMKLPSKEARRAVVELGDGDDGAELERALNEFHDEAPMLYALIQSEFVTRQKRGVRAPSWMRWPRGGKGPSLMWVWGALMVLRVVVHAFTNTNPDPEPVRARAASDDALRTINAFAARKTQQAQSSNAIDVLASFAITHEKLLTPELRDLLKTFAGLVRDRRCVNAWTTFAQLEILAAQQNVPDDFMQALTKAGNALPLICKTSQP